MNFGEMVKVLHRNKLAIAERPGWNGAFIAVVPEKVIANEKITTDTRRLIELYGPVGAKVAPLIVPAYFVLFYRMNTLQMGWNASAEDALAEDWKVIEEAFEDATVIPAGATVVAPMGIATTVP